MNTACWKAVTEPRLYHQMEVWNDLPLPAPSPHMYTIFMAQKSCIELTTVFYLGS